MKEIKNFIKEFFSDSNLDEFYPIYPNKIHLRFELGGNYKNGSKKRINQAFDRVSFLFNEIFPDLNEEIWVLINEYRETKLIISSQKYLYTLFDKSVKFKSKLSETGDPDEKIKFIQRFSKLFIKNVDYEKILKGIINSEQGKKPSIGETIIFISPNRKLVFFLYDDRGCVIYANESVQLKNLLMEKKSWVIDSYGMRPSSK